MLNPNQTIRVSESLPRERLDVFLRGVFPTLSRGTLQRLILQGDISVDGQTVKPTHHPRLGEEIQIRWPEPTPSVAQPEDIPLQVLFEDEHLLVLNKQLGLVVHPAAGN